jgi:hypothetical protein
MIIDLFCCALIALSNSKERFTFVIARGFLSILKCL